MPEERLGKVRTRTALAIVLVLRGLGLLLSMHALQNLIVVRARFGFFLLALSNKVNLVHQIIVPRVVQQGIACLAFHGLALKQHCRHCVHLLLVSNKHIVGAIMGFLHQTRYFRINAACCLIGVILRVAVIASQEHFVVRLAKHLRSQLRAHAVLRHNRARNLSSAFQVVASARGNVVAENLFRNATAHEHRQLVKHLTQRVQHFIFLRNGQRVAQCATTRDNRNLVDRIRVLKQVTDQRMTAFVVRDSLLRMLVHNETLALGTSHNALHGLGNLGLRDNLLVAASRQQRAFVHKVRKVGARKARRERCHALQVHVRTQRLVLGVHFQNALAALYVGRVHHNLAVETTRAQQRGVQNIHAVRSSNKHHSIILVKAVHLNKQLIQRLFAFIVAAAYARTALTTNGIDLINEDNGRTCLFGLVEQVAHTGSTHAHEHFHKVRTRNAEERHARLACNSTREQRFTRTRRAHQKAAARNLCAHSLIFVGICQEILDLAHFLHGFIHAGNIVKRHIGALFLRLARLRLAEVHLGIRGAIHLNEEENHQARQQQNRQNAAQRLKPSRRKLHFIRDIRMLAQKLHQGVLPNVGRRVRMQRSQVCCIHALGRHNISCACARCGIQRLKALVEGIGAFASRRAGNVILARYGVLARVIHHRNHAIFVDRLHKIRGDKRIDRFRVLIHKQLLRQKEEGEAKDEHKEEVYARIFVFLLIRHATTFLFVLGGTFCRLRL